MGALSSSHIHRRAAIDKKYQSAFDERLHADLRRVQLRHKRQQQAGKQDEITKAIERLGPGGNGSSRDVFLAEHGIIVGHVPLTGRANANDGADEASDGINGPNADAFGATAMAAAAAARGEGAPMKPAVLALGLPYGADEFVWWSIHNLAGTRVHARA